MIQITPQMRILVAVEPLGPQRCVKLSRSHLPERDCV